MINRLPKTKKLVIAFDNSTSAMGFEQMAKENNLKGHITSLPPAVNAGCGSAYIAPLDQKQNIQKLLEENSWIGAGMHEVEMR